MIKIYKNTISQAEIDTVIGMLERLPEYIWRQSDCTDEPVDQIKEFLPQAVCKILNSVYMNLYIPILSDFKIKICIPENYNYAIDRRLKGYSLNLHTDIPTGKFLRHKGSNPEDSLTAISAILYLSDDFEGGELRFDHNGEIYKPIKGDLIAFLPTLEHEILEIKKGVRYSCQFFYTKPDNGRSN